MRKFLLFVAILPMVCFAQKSKSKTKAPVKTAAVKTVVQEPDPEKPADGYLITANVVGYPDGTGVALLNGNTGQPEATGMVQKGKFTLTGKNPFPDFKFIILNNRPPYITLFLDNSLVKINAKSDSLEYAYVSGSASHNEYMAFSNVIRPYQNLLASTDPADSNAKKNAVNALTGFVKQNPNSYISPLAVYRIFQLNSDVDILDGLFNQLSPPVKAGSIGAYISQQLVILKRNPIGKPLADFSQPDSTGKMISLSSLRGKYVLIDFWASWCGPCRQENPNVVATYNKYKNKNYTVLGVSFDRSKQPWIDAIKTDGLNWAHVSDLQGWSNSVGQQFQITQIPQNFLIDPNGILIAKNLRGPALESKLASLLGN